MNRFFVMLFFCLTKFISFAQETIKHKVVSGDSFYAIAKKYNVNENDIYNLNPKAKGQTLKLNSILVIPYKKAKTKISQDFHIVTSGESFYTIAKKYAISVEELKNLNPTVSTTKLQIGTNLVIQKNATTKDSEKEIGKKNVSANDLIHTVKKGETISYITEMYAVSFKDLKKLNPALDVKLQINEKIIIRRGNEKETKVLIEPKVESDKIISPIAVQLEQMAAEDDSIEEPDESGEITHVVAKGETLITIAKKYNITLENLKALNPKVSDKIFPGRKLIVKKGIISDAKPQIDLYEQVEDIFEETTAFSNESIEFANQLVAISSEHLGTRYKRGGIKSGGFDCSGLMSYTFNQIDIKLPRTSNEQSRTGKKIKKENAQKGDLIFFSTNGRGTINHVGMITEIIDDEIFFIHSSVKRGVVVSSLSESYYTKRFVKINRVLQ